ncbi:MAG: tripartite tricarboxylate transporter TctB family protein [Rhodobacterales bacterium]|nr:tripartite tricarboxylate transporter TctB family protein [Rhodobacterales bacterium]
MALDKWIAVLFLAICLIYGYAAFTYPLLPFERNMAFLPNTMPSVLSILGAGLSLMILLSPKPAGDAEGDVLGTIDLTKWRDYKVGQALGMVAAMVVYALALRPVGFIAATTLFLFGTSFILGERRWVRMAVAALAGALTVWLLVQEALGIFLRPLPWFLG